MQLVKVDKTGFSKFFNSQKGSYLDKTQRKCNDINFYF